ncbi:MAG: hypothetical protein JW893_02985 [Candidatus Omnitrophica bacterium]|nr:hypothetical protein [Candidatus Omnitrophota bacterium]
MAWQMMHGRSIFSIMAQFIAGQWEIAGKKVLSRKKDEKRMKLEYTSAPFLILSKREG